jgi:DNA-binding LacI/PurR family transcriptional regulator
MASACGKRLPHGRHPDKNRIREEPAMPVKMEDVAKQAGVSITTVSHVLNRTRPVAPLTRDRVLAAVREMKYYANASARLLVRGRSNAFGLLVSDIENPFFPELIKGFETAAFQAGSETLLCSTNYDSSQARMAIRRFIENQVRGVAVMTSQLDPPLIEEMLELDIAVLLLDGQTTRKNQGVIRVDYSQGAQEAAAHLSGLGHRQIAFVTGPQNRLSAVNFRQVLLEALRQVRMPAPWLIEGNNRVDGGEKAAQKILAEKKRLTAVLCGNDLAALGVMRALTAAGCKVPRDVSVLGVDDIALAQFFQPALTTIRIPRGRLGQLSFEQLEKMLRTQRRRGVETYVETHLVVRHTTGPATKA